MVITIARRPRAPPTPPAMAAMFEDDPPPEFWELVGSGVEVTVVIAETQTVESAGGRFGSVVVGGEVVSEDIVGGAGTKDLGVQGGGMVKGKSPE